MAGELTIIGAGEVRAITSDMPAVFGANHASRDNCMDFGERLLAEIRERGMDEELDARAAGYVEKSRKTVSKMNSERAAFTKLFDTVRSKFTSLENDIDPLKQGTPAWRVQRERNAWAAKRREEELRRQEEERRRAERLRLENDTRTHVEREAEARFRDLLGRRVVSLQDMFGNATLGDADRVEAAVRECPDAMPQEAEAQVRSGVPFPAGPGFDRALFDRVLDETMAAALPGMRARWAEAVSGLRRDLLEAFPEKRAQLERAARASAEEAERIRLEMEAAEAREARRREEERLRREEEERAAAEAERQRREMAGLFEQAAAAQEAPVPRAKVTKRIELLNPEGVLPVVSLWFAREGCGMSVEELSKMFKKQVSYCERLANAADPVLIRDESVAYVDEVKAR